MKNMSEHIVTEEKMQMFQPDTAEEFWKAKLALATEFYKFHEDGARGQLAAMKRERDEARGMLQEYEREMEKARRQLNELRGWVREAIANLEFEFPDCALATLRQAEKTEE
jgi:hypothetical protein